MSSLQEAPAVLPSFVSSKARVTPTEMFIFFLGSVLRQSCFFSFCFLSLQMPKSLFFLMFHQSTSGVNALPSQCSPLSTQLVSEVLSGTCSLALCSETSACAYRERDTKQKQIAIKTRMQFELR